MRSLQGNIALAQTVNTGAEYHVFLTSNGESNGLYLVNKAATGFDVRENGHGNASIALDYRIMAKRNGYESVRLVDVTDRLKQQAEQRQQVRHPTTARSQAHPSEPLKRRPCKPVVRIPQMRVPSMPTQRTVMSPQAKLAELK